MSPKVAAQRRDNREFGTPLWAAPEQLTSHFYDEKIDVWALGCVVVEMASGQEPWTETGFSQTKDQLIRALNVGEIPLIPSAQ